MFDSCVVEKRGCFLSLIEQLEQIFPEDNILVKEKLSKHTTFRIGGACDIMLIIQNVQQLQDALIILKNTGTPYFLLGNGSNLLADDQGYAGVILKLQGDFKKMSVEEDCIQVGAGVLMSIVAQKAAENGLSGLEFASGIPGTIGGGVIMNAGAYDGELKQVVTDVTIMTKEGVVKTLSNETMQFSYRSSAIKNTGDIVLFAHIKLQRESRTLINEKMRDFAERRRAKQPLELPSAGSTFKRPEGYFAGKLIEDAGLKGYQVGGAMVSEKHCGFVVNADHASSDDVKKLIQDVQERVYEQFGVHLEKEVIYL